MTRVAIVIPYYQRDAGLLSRAVASVLAQDVDASTTLSIIVVDDESPRPASADLDDLIVPPKYTLTLLKQANAGPGAARNTGLDQVARESADFVAFLDSDDEWTPGHLRSALATLGDDGDFYFDDHTRIQYPGDASYFAAGGRLARWSGDMEPLPDEGLGMHRATVLRPFLEDCLAQSSTVVFRQATLGHLRFDPALRSLGEDLLFWLDLARVARSTRLSRRVGAHCGAGVSIFHSALSWDHPDAPMRFAYSLLLWTKVRERFDLAPEERAFVDDRIAGFRRGFTYIWLRAALRTRTPHRASMAMLRRQLGWGLGDMAAAGVAVVRRKLARQTPFPEH